MPITPTFPGIYIQELPSSAHTITAAPTSVTVFVGYTHPFKTRQFGKPVELFSFTDYERAFGGFFRGSAFDAESRSFGDLAQAVNQFFLNGGADAFVVGLQPRPGGQPLTPATATVGPLTFTAREIVDTDHLMQVTVGKVTATGSPPGSPPGDDTADVTITYGPPPDSPFAGRGAVSESYRQVSLYSTTAAGKPNPNFVGKRLGDVSALTTAAVGSPPGLLQAGTASFGPALKLPAGGTLFNAPDFTAAFQQDSPLDKLPLFNLLVLPGVTDNGVLSAANAFCERKRAFLIVDPPPTASADGTDLQFPTPMETAVDALPASTNAAYFFPYLQSNDPLTGLAVNPVTSLPYEIPPSGTVAGVFARTDLNRGVWKAPAGLETTLNNVTDVVERGRMTDQRQGVLNLRGVNCVRNFPGVGPVVFGSRTSVSTNLSLQQWKYVPVRRMALFIEQTLFANLGWVVFEPNDDPLWTAIRTSIESFMLGLFRQGAFQGDTPSEAFQVKCDDQTTTQDDINNGIVNIVVAFAPLKPAEFVIIKISQLAGQAQAS
jgi:phage tail sheath protein FI